jgi:hypothetical protein
MKSGVDKPSLSNLRNEHRWYALTLQIPAELLQKFNDKFSAYVQTVVETRYLNFQWYECI